MITGIVTSFPGHAAKLAGQMPDVVKLTVVGIGMDPPPFDLTRINPTMVKCCEHLVVLGVVSASGNPSARSYVLTDLGRQVFAIVSVQSPSDGTIPANDFDGGRIIMIGSSVG